MLPITEQSRCHKSGGVAAFLQQFGWVVNMDLIAVSAIFVASIGVGLAGAQAILSGVLCLARRPIAACPLEHPATGDARL